MPANKRLLVMRTPPGRLADCARRITDPIPTYVRVAVDACSMVELGCQ
jgi:hypothetical protein